MTVATLRPAVVARLLPIAAAIVACGPASAEAGGGRWARRSDCGAPSTFRTRCEYRPEFLQARRLESLDCGGLVGYAESVRASANQNYLATYNRYRPAATTGPALPPLPDLDSVPPPPPPPEDMEAAPVPPPVPPPALPRSPR